jgi:hypothetical protein
MVDTRTGTKHTEESRVSDMNNVLVMWETEANIYEGLCVSDINFIIIIVCTRLKNCKNSRNTSIVKQLRGVAVPASCYPKKHVRVRNPVYVSVVLTDYLKMRLPPVVSACPYLYDFMQICLGKQ